MLAGQILEILRETLRPAGPVALHEPVFAGNEWVYLKDCLDSTFVSSVGQYVNRFEEDLAAFTGAARAVAVVNGTAALHVALLLSGVRAGDEVLVPALTFVATANAVSYLSAVPHFVDSEEASLGLSPARLGEYLERIAEIRGGQCVNRKTGRTIRAVVPMHVFGLPVDMDALLKVADRFHLAVVEDAAEALGSLYHGRHAGTLARMGVLSFNGNKLVTTGGGGAILTDDIALADRARHLTTTARVPHPFEVSHDELGFNYRMPNINAALGCAQMEALPGFLVKKRALALAYEAAFSGLPGVAFVQEPEGCQSNYWLNAILLAPDRATERDDILRLTNEHGLMTRPAWTLMPDLPMYRSCPSMELPVARDLVRRIVNLPSGPGLMDRAKREGAS
ncbi:MAG: LegC family aminotransferase [Proteobacteria bacterium]|nr:LegC family aminotransferase [Pseudomonadota bacterium]